MQKDYDDYLTDEEIEEIESEDVDEEKLEQFENDTSKSFHSYLMDKTWDLTTYSDNEEIIQQLKEDKNLTEEERGELMYVLIRKNMKIVYKLISRRAKPFILSNEDLYFEGLNSIKKAIDRYEFGHGTKFSTFLFYVVDNDLKALVKKASVEYNRTVSLDQDRTSNSHNNEQSLIDIITDERRLPSDAWKSEENTKAVNEALKKLTIQERFIICKTFEMRGLEKNTQEDIGDYMDISQVTVATYQRNGMETLRKVFNEMNISIDDLAYLFAGNA